MVMADIWNDITSYSRNNKERVPQTWELKRDSLRIRVSRHINYEPDQWLLSCREFGIDNHLLKSKNIEEAKNEALVLLYYAAKAMMGELKISLQLSGVTGLDCSD